MQQVGQDASEPLDTKMLTINCNGVQTKVPALVSTRAPFGIIHLPVRESELDNSVSAISDAKQKNLFFLKHCPPPIFF